MAHSPLTPFEAWRQAWVTLKGVPSLRRIKERLNVIGAVNWQEPSAQKILTQWMNHLDFGPHLAASLKHLDAMKEAGALPLGWRLPLPTRGVVAPHLVVRLLRGQPDRVAPHLRDKWVTWACQALQDTPADLAFLDHALKDRLLTDLWRQPAHRPVLEAACHHHPRSLNEPWVHDSLGQTLATVWADARVTPAQWDWMQAHGMNPHHTVPGHRPFWWLACEQNCETAWTWIRANDPAQAEQYRVFRYFRTLAQPTHQERTVFEQYEARLFKREDWATVKNEGGRSALWQMAHHHVEWLCHRLPPYLLALAHWREATDEAGRNLAIAVLSYTGPNPNGNRETALRRLAMEGVTLAPDGLGRGVMISLPGLKTEQLDDAMRTYPSATAWWQGTPTQVDEALRHVAHTPTTWREWSRVLSAVPSKNPVLRGAEWLLSVVQPAWVPWVPDDRPMDWPLAMEDSPLMEKALASSQAPQLLALRQAHLALTLTPTRLQHRSRHRT